MRDLWNLGLDFGCFGFSWSVCLRIVCFRGLGWVCSFAIDLVWFLVCVLIWVWLYRFAFGVGWCMRLGIVDWHVVGVTFGVWFG